MADQSGGPDWEHGSDGKWYQPGVLSGAGWWRASDDRWYRPEQAPGQPPAVHDLPAAHAKPCYPSRSHTAETPPGKHLAWAPLHRDPRSTSYVWGEAWRPLSGDEDLQQAIGLDDALRATIGFGLQRHVMGGEDLPITSDAYNARELMVDPLTGVMAGCTGLSHWSFGLPGALDLGLRDGRNIVGWSDEVPEAMMSALESLYIGNAQTGRFEMAAMGGEIGGLSLSPDATSVAWIEWRGRDLAGFTTPGFIFEEHLDSGKRRLLGVLDQFSGVAPVRYSPDGAWLLVGATRLIRMIDGAALELPEARASAWAPPLGDSTLLRVAGSADAMRLASFDLATGNSEDLGPLEVEEDAVVLYLADLDVHPSELQALAISPYGYPEPYRNGEGARGKLQMLDIEARRLTPVTSPTVPGFSTIERDQERPRWVADRRGGAVRLTDALESQLQIPVVPPEVPPGSVTDLAFMLAQRCATDLEPDHRSRNPARVRVELLRSVLAIAESDPGRASEVVSTLREFTFPLAFQALGPIDPVRGIDYSQRPMVALDSGLQAMADGDFNAEHWEDSVYLPG